MQKIKRAIASDNEAISKLDAMENGSTLTELSTNNQQITKSSDIQSSA